MLFRNKKNVIIVLTFFFFFSLGIGLVAKGSVEKNNKQKRLTEKQKWGIAIIILTLFSGWIYEFFYLLHSFFI